MIKLIRGCILCFENSSVKASLSISMAGSIGARGSREGEEEEQEGVPTSASVSRGREEQDEGEANEDNRQEEAEAAATTEANGNQSWKTKYLFGLWPLLAKPKFGSA